MALTPKRSRFVDEYVVDFNATAAAIRAGYSERTAKQQGQRLLTNVDVQLAVARRAKELAAVVGVEAERVVRELARLGFSDIRNVLDWNEESMRLRIPEELSDDAAATIKSVEETETVLRSGKGPEQTITRRRKITVHDKLGALVALGKYTGVVPVAGGATLNMGGDHRQIHVHFDGGPDAAERSA